MNIVSQNEHRRHDSNIHSLKVISNNFEHELITVNYTNSHKDILKRIISATWMGISCINKLI